MLKKLCCALLSALLLQAASVPALGKTDAEKEAERAAKVRAEINKLGTGKAARVRVELRDKTKLEGYVSEVGADSFAVTDASGRTTSVPYTQVRKASGNNLSKGVKVAILVGVGVGVALGLSLVLQRVFYPHA
ncbi:MAG: hypothetical protein M3348_01225 [Acidobacteriota bacterium]|nr:hypothetical protein [Acidobacteriota bacterium]